MAEGPFSRCLHETLLKLHLGTTLTSTLETLANPEQATVPNLANILNDNQAYEHLLRKSDLIKKRKSSLMEDDTPNETDDHILQTVALLGKQGTRNALIALRLNRILETGIPKADGEMITLNIPKVLRHAIEAEDFSSENRIAHSDMSFAGGLLFDWLEAIAGQNGNVPKTAAPYLEDLWKQSMRTAQFAYHIGAALKTFKYQNYAFASGLALQLGRYLMFILHPEWPSFVEQMKEAKFDEFNPCFQMAERKAFSLTHAEFSSLIVSFFNPLRPMEKAIGFYQEPYILRTAHPDLFRLSVILSVAHRLSSHGPAVRKVAKTMGDLLNRNQVKWLKEISITDKTILDAIKAYKSGDR